MKEPYQVIQFYCGRGKMENFIKEGKSGFDFAAVSSHSKIVNANRMRLHMLAYNLFNWFTHGQALTRIFTEEKEVMTVIEKAILLFKDEGIAGERFADTVKRLGFEYVNEKLIG